MIFVTRANFPWFLPFLIFFLAHNKYSHSSSSKCLLSLSKFLHSTNLISLYTVLSRESTTKYFSVLHTILLTSRTYVCPHIWWLIPNYDISSHLSSLSTSVMGQLTYILFSILHTLLTIFTPAVNLTQWRNLN